MDFKKLIFAFLLIGQVSAQTPGKELTYLSYNILYGFNSDSLLKDQYINWVKPIDPDIVAYQETNKFTQKTLEQFAERYNHPYAILAKEPGFPVALTSRYPIVNVQKVLDNMWHGYIYANILDYHIFVLHLSPFSYRKRQHEIRQIIAHAKLLPEKSKIIFSGDFNSLAEIDQAQYGPDVVASMKKSEEEREIVRNLNNGMPDYTVLKQMTDAGYVDVFHKVNGKFKDSIPTKKYATANSKPKRIDFIWVSPNLSGNLLSSEIIHDQDTDVLSDHYPVIMKIRR
jgi:exodeoxyribonuclease-3